MTQQFYMVALSLPRMGASFKTLELPLSRFQLERRLTSIPNEQESLLYAIESLVWTSWFMPQYPLSRTKNDYQYILQSKLPFVVDVVDWYLDLRSIFAAIRMREQKKEVPKNPQEYWLSRWGYKLLRHWDEPDFGLKAVYPWLPKVVSETTKNNTAAVEEFLLDHIWRHLSLIEMRHYFDFEALILYLLRWNIVNYWSTFSEANVLDGIDELCNSLINLGDL